MEMHVLLVVVRVSGVCTYVKTDQTVRFICVLFTVCQLHLKNAVFKEGKASHRGNPRPRTNRISNVCKTY